MSMPQCIVAISLVLLVSSSQAADELTLEQIKASGATQSKYHSTSSHPVSNVIPKANLERFRTEIEPILAGSCVECHGPDQQNAKFRADTLDPDLVHGEDVSWWLEVMDVLSNGEMPPENEAGMNDEDRGKVIDWLSSEIQFASQVRRSEGGHSSFRRMTRYEYSYVLQDLLGLPLDFGKDLLPDPVSVDGFQNSSEMLQMSISQYGTYFELNRDALNRATVRGERPEMLYWGISAERAATRRAKTVQELDDEIQQDVKKIGEDSVEKEVETDAFVRLQATQ